VHISTMRMPKGEEIRLCEGVYKHYKNAKGIERMSKGEEIRLSSLLCKGIYKH
jgi:hypothetical protein